MQRSTCRRGPQKEPILTGQPPQLVSKSRVCAEGSFLGVFLWALLIILILRTGYVQAQGQQTGRAKKLQHEIGGNTPLIWFPAGLLEKWSGLSLRQLQERGYHVGTLHKPYIYPLYNSQWSLYTAYILIV